MSRDGLTDGDRGDVGERGGRSDGCLRIDYDVDSPNPAYGGLTIPLEHANGSGCNALRIRLRGEPSTVKIELHGAGGAGVTRVTGIRPDAWKELTIPYLRFGGMITDWTDLTRLVIVFEDATAQPKTGVLWLDDIALMRDTKRRD
jgi:hypothetical protein